MILELDCGNSFIKWRLIESDAVAPRLGGIAVGVEDILLGIPDGCLIKRCRMVSVRDDKETETLLESVQAALGVAVVRATPARNVAGVTNGYRDFDRLGMDRWLAVVGAFHMCQTACLIIDLGTAVTADIVDSAGRHLGGFIAPGIGLMRGQLLSHTRRIYYGASEAESALADLGPGKSTAEAVERGCIMMLRAYVNAQVEEARSLLKSDFVVYVTGGDAALAAGLPGAQFVPDLVFRGLAVACP
ncbi:type III pantothenate kinase [Stutzerimonas stutzeri]